MIIDKVVEFFKKIFKINNQKLIAEKSESTKQSASSNEFVEKINIKELEKKKSEEIEKKYDINNKEDFFKVYNLVKEEKIALDYLSMKWVVQIDLMMQQEIDLLEGNTETA